jgi:hypothetical protein
VQFVFSFAGALAPDCRARRNAEMDEALNEAPDGARYNTQGRNRIAIRPIELRDEVRKWLEAGDAQKCQGHERCAVNRTARARLPVSSLCIGTSFVCGR